MNVTEKKLQVCPGCDRYHISEEWISKRLAGRGASVLWCGNCGFGWQYPLPTPKEINDYYSNVPPYILHGEHEKEKGMFARVKALNKLMPKKGRLLDIGSGSGQFLNCAKSEGWDVCGVEPQQSAAENCKKYFNIDVHNGTIEDLNIAAESYDAITLWDILEHVHEPLEFLRECIKILSPGGIIVISIPNASGWPAKIFKGNWRYVMSTHLSYFRFPYFKNLLINNGLEIVKTKHTMKVQSLLQGIEPMLPFKINSEQLIRAGRKSSIEYGRIELESMRHKQKNNKMKSIILAQLRKFALTLNLTPLPLPVGDLVDVYCRKHI